MHILPLYRLLHNWKMQIIGCKYNNMSMFYLCNCFKLKSMFKLNKFRCIPLLVIQFHNRRENILHCCSVFNKILHLLIGSEGQNVPSWTVSHNPDHIQVAPLLCFGHALSPFFHQKAPSTWFRKYSKELMKCHHRHNNRWGHKDVAWGTVCSRLNRIDCDNGSKIKTVLSQFVLDLLALWCLPEDNSSNWWYPRRGESLGMLAALLRQREL